MMKKNKYSFSFETNEMSAHFRRLQFVKKTFLQMSAHFRSQLLLKKHKNYEKE